MPPPPMPTRMRPNMNTRREWAWEVTRAPAEKKKEEIRIMRPGVKMVDRRPMRGATAAEVMRYTPVNHMA